MIYAAAVFPGDSGRIVIRTPRSVDYYVGRTVVGSFLIFVGGLVLCAFLFGDGPSPTGSGAQLVFGWLVVSLFFLALGVWPFLGGLTVLFVTGSFCICPAQRLIESRLAVGGLVLWIRRHPFQLFDRVTIWHYRAGFPVSRDRFLVSAEGPSRRVRISTATDPAASERLASVIAAALQVHVEKGELYGNSRQT